MLGALYSPEDGDGDEEVADDDGRHEEGGGGADGEHVERRVAADHGGAALLHRVVRGEGSFCHFGWNGGLLSSTHF